MHSIKDLFETMLILERSAVAPAANRVRPDQIEDLQRINAGLGEAWYKKNYLRVTLLNSKFHSTIYQPTDNSFLFSYLGNLQLQPQRLAYMCFNRDLSSYDIQSHAELSIKDHQSLIDLFKQNADVATVRVISEHVKFFQRRINQFMFPSLDILDAVTPLQGDQNLTSSSEAQTPLE